MMARGKRSTVRGGGHGYGGPDGRDLQSPTLEVSVEGGKVGEKCSHPWVLCVRVPASRKGWAVRLWRTMSVLTTKPTQGYP